MPSSYKLHVFIRDLKPGYYPNLYQDLEYVVFGVHDLRLSFATIGLEL